MFKATKGIQVSVHMPFEHILFFRISYLNFKLFKVVSKTNSELYHIQNPGYIDNSVNIPCENLAY